MSIKRIIYAAERYFSDADYRFLINSDFFGTYDSMPDREYIERKYRALFGKKLNLDIPKTFNEKLQWLKLNDRRPEYITMVDKSAVKKYVSELIGEEYIIPTLGEWDTPADIDFGSLPNQFVLKCNHNSGLGMYICRDKSQMKKNKVIRGLKKGLRQDYYLTNREWPYKGVPRKVIAEKYMESGGSGLTDYKVHCFNGVPKFVLVCKDRFTKMGLTEDFFTPSWERIPVRRPAHPNAVELPERPKELEEILSLARVLSKDIPFVRVDFYIVDHRVYFSELTFFPAAGLEKFEPSEWDETFGEWLDLSMAK